MDLHSFPTRRSSDLSIQRRSSLLKLTHGDRPGRELVDARDRRACRITERDAEGLRTRCGRDLHAQPARTTRSEEHTSELQSLRHLVCRLLLEKKKE